MTDIVQTLAGETQGRLLRLLRRAPMTITELSRALELTDNAIRTHVATLARDGLVREGGSQRDTGGKPARIYALTAKGEELFPKAYATVLNGLVAELGRTEGWERTEALLRAVGARSAAGAHAGGGADARVESALTALRGLGADIDRERTPEGWLLRGYACPLGAVTTEHPQVCSLVAAMVSEITGRPVTECCDRTGAARCRFEVAEA